MNEFALDDELVQDYLAESREHLVTIECDLLAIEQAGANIDEQLVNRVFRAAHSIKGGAGFFDFLKIKELAHRTENVLDLVRSRQMIPDPQVVNILLSAFDKLGDLLLDFSNSNDADISEFTDALNGLTDQNLGVRKNSTNETILVSVPHSDRKLLASAFEIEQAQKGGRSLYFLNYDLIHDVQRRGETPLTILKRLLENGTIISTSVDILSAGTLDDAPTNQLFWDVLITSALESDSVSEILSLRPDQVHLLDLTASYASTVTAPSPENDPEPIGLKNTPPLHSPTLRQGTSEVSDSPSKANGTGSSTDVTIRLNVALLDSLMTLAGELVLGRNQLNEAIRNRDQREITASAHRISLVTSELQEAVSLTRMQPVSGLFSKFPRLVRDLAGELGKEIQLKLEGGEVELDKTILENLSDPLTHMVRNSVDHGIESPAVRIAQKKAAGGTITLRAQHQAGQVVIEIIDDGKGLSGENIAISAVRKGLISAEQIQTMSESEKQALIFLPGVSTAEKLSNISGRGVGMDVVKTNLDKLGGKVEIDSTPGQGSTFRIKLPLTLAIIPSLLVSDGGERFAIPQVSVAELVRIPADQVSKRIERAGDAEVVLLRDRLVPLVHLSSVLGDKQSETHSRALNIVLVDSGNFEYGLVVEELHDTVEIVVKPMGRHLQELQEYAGATILGDGQVAVILDAAGLASRAGLRRGTAPANAQSSSEESAVQDIYSLLLFQNAPGEHCAVPIELITRIEKVRADQVQSLGGRRTMRYGNSILPLVALHDLAAVDELTEKQQWVVIVFDCAGKSFGLLAAEPLDMVETRLTVDTTTLRQPGVAGSAVLEHNTTLLLDIFELSESVRKNFADPTERAWGTQASSVSSGTRATVLVAEDSEFFRSQITRLVEAVGYNVLAAEDGQSAWELLDRYAGQVSVVTTDVEMPRLDGLGLCKRIRADERFKNLPVIALSSLAGEDEIARGFAMGVSQYQVKLDQGQLLESIQKAVSGGKLERLSL